MADSDFADDLARELSDTSLELERIRDIADTIGKSMTDAFKGAALEGQSLNMVLSDIARKLADVTLTAALKPVGSLISSAVESVFTATNPTLGALPFAKGGIVNSPRNFSLGGGQMGLMGEAGAEAILPLQRGANGELGVAATGGGGMSITFNVSTPNAQSFRQSEAEISGMLLRAVKRGQRSN